MPIERSSTILVLVRLSNFGLGKDDLQHSLCKYKGIYYIYMPSACRGRYTKAVNIYEEGGTGASTG